MVAVAGVEEFQYNSPRRRFALQLVEQVCKVAVCLERDARFQNCDELWKL